MSLNTVLGQIFSVSLAFLTSGLLCSPPDRRSTMVELSLSYLLGVFWIVVGSTFSVIAEFIASSIWEVKLNLTSSSLLVTWLVFSSLFIIVVSLVISLRAGISLTGFVILWSLLDSRSKCTSFSLCSFSLHFLDYSRAIYLHFSN